MPPVSIPAFIVAIMLAVAACSGGASPSPSAQASTTTEPSVAASAQASSTTEPSVAASAQASSTSTPVPAPSSQAGVTVGTRKSSLGTFLIGPDGKTLYLFEADMTSRSTCSGACAQNWPPLTTKGTPIAGGGVRQSLLATRQRGDGTNQVVYNGHPLYYFAGDTKPGDTLGEGLTAFGAGWDVVSPAGTKIEKPGG